MTIRNLDEANKALLPYVPLVKELTGKDLTLERIRPLMKLLGNPEKRLSVVHIAGTSGKTSTAYFAAALLRAAGKKVGLTVSPHIDSVNERVQINGQPLAEAEFCELLNEFLEIIQQVEQAPSYFELLYAFALWVFDRLQVDYAVVETGLGGLHDATNIAERPDKVCLITDIGFDHTHILGDTLPKITTQKAGIIHPGNHVFMYEQTPEIMKVVANQIRQQAATLHIVQDLPLTIETPNLAEYQQRNWKLAYAAFEYLTERDKLKHLTSKVLLQTQITKVPARMDIQKYQGKTLVMDGAHNAQKMFAFISGFRQLYPRVRPAILLAVKDGKEYESLVPLLVPLASRIITTTFEATQDLPVISMNADTLAQALLAGGAQQVAVIPDQLAALRTVLTGPETVCVITGSFYLIGQLRSRAKLVS